MLLTAAGLSGRRETARQLYAEHADRSFFPKLMEYIGSGPSFAIELQAEGAVEKWRQMIGPTDPEQARKEVRCTHLAFAHLAFAQFAAPAGLLA